MPVTGPANVQQTGSQPACRTCHLVPPLVARSDSSRSYVRDTGSLFVLGMMQVSDRIADSDIVNLTNAPIEDPEFPLPVSLDELD